MATSQSPAAFAAPLPRTSPAIRDKEVWAFAAPAPNPLEDALPWCWAELLAGKSVSSQCAGLVTKR